MTASVKLSGSGEQSEDLLVAGRNIPLLPIAALLTLFLLILLFLLDLACYRLRQRGFFTLDRIFPPECSTKPLPLFYLFFFLLLWFPFQPGATYLLCHKVRQCRKLGGRAPSYAHTYYSPTHVITYVNIYLLEYSYITFLGRGGRAVPRGQTVSSAAR